jgi:hypothetical protein
VAHPPFLSVIPGLFAECGYGTSLVSGATATQRRKPRSEGSYDAVAEDLRPVAIRDLPAGGFGTSRPVGVA